jgi:hypothetical protein
MKSADEILKPWPKAWMGMKEIKSVEKGDYFLIAEQMKPEEIPSEVSEKLSAIYSVVCPES